MHNLGRLPLSHSLRLLGWTSDSPVVQVQLSTSSSSSQHHCYSTSSRKQRKLTHKEFRRQIIMSLCDEQRQSRSCHMSRRQDETLERLRGSHFPETAPSRRDCRICSRRGRPGERHLTTTVYGTCSDLPHLCVGECFRRYHTQRHL